MSRNRNINTRVLIFLLTNICRRCPHRNYTDNMAHLCDRYRYNAMLIYDNFCVNLPRQLMSVFTDYRWLGTLVVRASDLRLSDREFDRRPPLYQSVGTACMGDRFWAGIPPRCVTTNQPGSHPGRLSLLLSVGREMSTGQSAVILYGWRSKAGWLILFVDKHVDGRQNRVIFVNTCHSERSRGE